MATETARRRAHVVLPQELIERIDARVGARGRSRFIQEAIEERLRRDERVEAFRDLLASHSGTGIPEWETAESTYEWVRRERAAWDRPRGGEPA